METSDIAPPEPATKKETFQTPSDRSFATAYGSPAAAGEDDWVTQEEEKLPEVTETGKTRSNRTWFFASLFFVLLAVLVAAYFGGYFYGKFPAQV
jgi:hypothetical protein